MICVILCAADRDVIMCVVWVVICVVDNCLVKCWVDRCVCMCPVGGQCEVWRRKLFGQVCVDRCMYMDVSSVLSDVCGGR